MPRSIPYLSPLMAALDFSHRQIAIVGGGAVARRKLPKLLATGAQVRLIAPGPPDLADVVAALQPRDRARVQLRLRPYTQSDLEGCTLVLACTDNPEVNQTVVEHAQALGVWCDRVDTRDSGDLAMAATSRLGPITLAATSGRTSPALAKLLRLSLDQSYGPEWAQVAQLADVVRNPLKTWVADPHERTRRLRQWVRSPLLEQLRSQDIPGAIQTTRRLLGLSPREVSNLQLLEALGSPSGDRVVISAFGPFPGVAINPTVEVAHAVARRLGSRVEVVELETCFDTAWEQLQDRLEPLRQGGQLRAVVALGVSSRATCVQLERIGVNVRVSTRADATGRRLPVDGEPLVPGGPDGLLSRMAVEALARTLKAMDQPIEVSNSAGTYVCNEVLYKLLAWANRTRFNGPAGFVHIPPVPHVLSHDRVVDSLVALLQLLDGCDVGMQEEQTAEDSDDGR
ncbi:MAG: NAD(P)-dependent oxidoreductase [Myxococcota bacterium]